MTFPTARPETDRPPLARHRSVPSTLVREPCDVEIVIPSLNEERRLPTTLAAVVAALETMSDTHSRVVVVDNGSADRTAEVVDRLARERSARDAADRGGAARRGRVELTVIGCSVRGKGAAVQRGVLTSGAAIIGFVDADLAVSPSVIPAAVRRVAAGRPVVIASRRCEGARYEVLQPPVRRLGGWAFRRAIGPLMPDVSDTQCGFKFFGADAARRVFEGMDVTGYAFDVELLMRAARQGYRIDELPVAWSDDSASQLRLASHAPEIARDILRLRRMAVALERARAFVPRDGVTTVPAAAPVRVPAPVGLAPDAERVVA